jgi:uncharacterized protein YdeI (YjbR/CyaY-like superfamily)
MANKKRPAAHMQTVEFRSRKALRDWLAQHHAHSLGIWVVTLKKESGGTVRWNDVVEEALCFGWVDSLPRKVDATRSMLLLTPRKPMSNWSAKNKAHVAELESQQLMKPAGKRAVTVAKKNGSWNALNDVSALVVPADLARALGEFKNATEYWNAFPPSIRRGILEWILNAKKSETRARRVQETARLASENVRANQWTKQVSSR